MPVLIIKISSLGDVIHTLPALSDVHQQNPAIQFDWVVEEAFAEIPTWHPTVRRVIPVALRRWRKKPLTAWRDGSWKRFKQAMQQDPYTAVIDAQGLIKSAWLGYQVRGERHGLDWRSCREPLASLSYHHRYSIPKQQHAVERIRQLFAAVFAYSVPNTPPNYGIKQNFSDKAQLPTPTLVFLHGTTWSTKHWYEAYWKKLADYAVHAGFQVVLPWGSSVEQLRAQRIAATHQHITVLPKSNLQALANVLANATAVVGVDTGLAHLAAALDTPSITLYGATQPAWTGTYGKQQQHLQAQFPCSPCLQRNCTCLDAATHLPSCYKTISPERVWAALRRLIEHSTHTTARLDNANTV